MLPMQKSHFPFCSRWGTTISLNKVFDHADFNGMLSILILILPKANDTSLLNEVIN